MTTSLSDQDAQNFAQELIWQEIPFKVSYHHGRVVFDVPLGCPNPNPKPESKYEEYRKVMKRLFPGKSKDQQENQQ